MWALVTSSVPWALLGWALHITADRSFGYYLRAGGTRPSPESSPAAAETRGETTR